MTNSARTFTRGVLAIGGLGYLMVLVTALVVMHLPPDIVLALTLGGILLVVVALRPYVGVQVFVFLLFFENVFEAREGLTPMKILGGIILGGWLLSLMARRQTGVRITLAVLAVVAFVVWNGICLMYAIDLETGVTRMFTFVQLAMAALMFASVVNTSTRLRGVCLAFVVWTCLATVIAIAQYYMGLTSMAVGPVGNRNLLALYINVAIVCAYMLHEITRDGRWRFSLLASLPLLFLGLALTFSRAGLIIMFVILLLVLWRVARRRSVLVLVGSAAVLCLMPFVFPSEFYERARSIVPAIQRQEDTFGTRVRLWRVAARMAQDRPIFGVGPGNFVAAYPRYARGGEMMTRDYVTHNAYFGILAETGIPGLLLFLAIGASVLVEVQRTIRAAREAGHPDLEMLAVAVEISVIAMLVASLSGNTEGLKLLWINAGMAMGLSRLRGAVGPIHSVAQASIANRVKDLTAAAHAGPLLSGKG